MKLTNKKEAVTTCVAAAFIKENKTLFNSQTD